ncbi:MAG TPA: SIS domain-containing protein [Bacteroidia bacterium]|jgi:D-sedoheptulose 7-phosphate isomerase|nr:SIS domain-containing protein [Bacteroidia bacterium]
MKQFELYHKEFSTYLSSPEVKLGIEKSMELVRTHNRISFIGNGGSNSICSHMMEDYMKMLNKRTSSFTDAAMITCFANDYGWERAMEEWIKFQFMPGDLLFAISSSGESKNILNATKKAKQIGGKVITFSGFNKDNSLGKLGDANIIIPMRSYGIVENLHSTILHIILDQLQGL